MKKIYNRLAIFVFYDEDGIVDKYVEYLLLNLAKQVQRTIVVVNGKINDISRKKLEVYTPEIYIRENKGYDAGAYKDILTKYLSLNEIKQFDEIVLLNDTFYGPILNSANKTVGIVAADYLVADFLKDIKVIRIKMFLVRGFLLILFVNLENF